jgi:hypothetical protein
MRRTPKPVTSLLTGAIAVATASAGLLAAGAGTADAHGRFPSFPAPAHAVPAHVYAPYFETYNGDDPAALSAQSGAKYLTLAFLGTDAPGSCTAYWNNDTTQPVSPSVYGAAVARIQRAGGTVIPSFGGYGADTTNTDIADSCTDVDAIARVYENVLTTYHTTRIDLDVEADSLTNTAGITRRNQAIAKVESWAARTHRDVSFSYTLPTTTTGLGATGVAVLADAVKQHARVDVVNAMAFDYWDGAQHDMGADAETAAQGVHDQLAALHPHTPSAALWHQIGLTLMQGIDDYGPTETTTLANAATVESFATHHGLASLSVWALQRDNGSCPGTKGAGTCSGVDQPTWAFSHTLERFTSRF